MPGVPILVAIILGIIFPYLAITLMPLGIVFLFLLMLWVSLSIDWTRLYLVTKKPFKVAVGLFFLYLFFPMLQWLLATSLVVDKQLVHGLVFASLCPVAIVAPYFTSIAKGDEELSFALMVSSMVLCPFVAPPLLKLMSGSSIAMDVGPLIKYMILLVTVPMVVGIVVWRYVPRIVRIMSPYIGILNIGTLSVLVFILFGTAVGKLNLSYSSYSVISIVVILAFVQDFGVLLISRVIFANLYDQKSRNALTISMSMKNVAIAAGLLLFYDPRASFPAALVFLAHAFLFSFVSFFRGSGLFDDGVRAAGAND